MHFGSLESIPLNAIHETFVEAFSDYVIPLHLSQAQLVEMLRRRGFDSRVSVGAFESDRLVGFTLNGLDSTTGPRAGYDSGSGVVPSHRRRGIAREMMERSCVQLRAIGAQRYVLEVIESNHGAEKLYQSCGFVKTRDLTCWTLNSESFCGRSSSSVLIEESEAIPERASEWQTWKPSWQNSGESIARAGAEHVTLVARTDARQVGFAVVFPGNGDVAQFAVHPEARRTGIGTALIAGAMSRTAGAIRMINVDGGDAATEAFLSSIGGRLFIRQIEMIRDL